MKIKTEKQDSNLRIVTCADFIQNHAKRVEAENSEYIIKTLQVNELGEGACIKYKVPKESDLIRLWENNPTDEEVVHEFLAEPNLRSEEIKSAFGAIDYTVVAKIFSRPTITAIARRIMESPECMGFTAQEVNDKVIDSVKKQ